MKTSINIITVCVMLCCIGASCKKQDIAEPQQDYTQFRIEKITGSLNTNKGMSFTYKSNGDPLSIVAIGATENMHADKYFLSYDANGRLTEFIAAYTWGNPIGFKFWHKYGYDAQDRISVDSAYFGGTKVNNQPYNVYKKEIDFFQYDAQNRITSVYTKDVNGKKTTTAKYTYDANGNRSDISKHYDNKVNFHRTNKVWQFLDRDYSMNNPLDIQIYPSYSFCGLPENIETVRVGLKRFVDFDYTFMIISYSSN